MSQWIDGFRIHGEDWTESQTGMWAGRLIEWGKVFSAVLNDEDLSKAQHCKWHIRLPAEQSRSSVLVMRLITV